MPPRQAAAFDQLLARIRAVPGVRAATYSNNGLFGGSDNGDRIKVEGYTPQGRRRSRVALRPGRPGYFSTLGIPVLLGREITEEDRAGGRMVCVINETFAKRFFAGRNPIGLHVTQKYADQRTRTGRRRRAATRARTGCAARSSTASTCRPRSRRPSISGVTFVIRPRGDERVGAGRRAPRRPAGGAGHADRARRAR